MSILEDSRKDNICWEEEQERNGLILRLHSVQTSAVLNASRLPSCCKPEVM